MSTAITIEDDDTKSSLQQPIQHHVQQQEPDVPVQINKDSGAIRNSYTKNKAKSSFVAHMGSGNEEPNAMSDLVRELAELNENLPLKARLNRNQIMAFSKAYWYAFRYHCQTLIDYCDAHLMLTISESGKGREELVRIGDAVARMEEAKKTELKI